MREMFSIHREAQAVPFAQLIGYLVSRDQRTKGQGV